MVKYWVSKTNETFDNTPELPNRKMTQFQPVLSNINEIQILLPKDTANTFSFSIGVEVNFGLSGGTTFLHNFTYYQTYGPTFFYPECGMGCQPDGNVIENRVY